MTPKCVCRKMAKAGVLPFVRGMDLSKYDFEKTEFHRDLYNMQNLKWLRMNRCAVSTLPEDLEKFPKLEILSAARNEVKELYSCNIPSCTQLRVLSVHHNNVRESGIPSDLFDLENLVTLDFSHNEISKVPENLLRATRLLVLNLGHNRLSQIPGALFVHCHDLFYLDLSSNQITSLPPQIRRLEHLQTLVLANNPLQHYTFKSIDKLKGLTTLNLSNTGRDLTNTPNLHMLKNLTDVDLSHNDLPRIPKDIYMLETLQRVNVSHNLIKELSSLVGTWTDLVTLDVSFNQLTALPNDICLCTKLRRLFLSDNRLTFEGIPAAVGKLVALEHFVAPRNCLECIPDGLARCYKLKRLILASNQLLTLPEGLYFLGELKEYDTRDNPNLVMPPKPTDALTGSGAEFYNIDFDPEKLKAGAVVSQSKPAARSFTSRMERNLRLARRMRSAAPEGDEAADKVLKGLARVAADTKNRREMEETDEASAEQSEMAGTKQRAWLNTLKRPDLKYKEIFPDDPGKVTGLTVWQIENFNPVQVDERYHGRFYTGDCYIVLHTFFDSKSNLDWQIWYWIGQESTNDKKACVAMHAVHLRNMLQAECRTLREEQGDESVEFEDLFGNEIQYIEGGTASGFYTTEEEAPPTVMYRIVLAKRLHLESVPMEVESLDQGHAYLLDAGKVLFIWQGKQSSLNARSKARLVAEKINKMERKNTAEVICFKSGLEVDEFWTYLGGVPTSPIERDPSLSAFKPVVPALFKVGMGKGYLELPQVEVPEGRLMPSLLDSSGVYVLDCGADIFVWIGRKSPRLVRAAAMRLSNELFSLLKRPKCARVTRVQEGTEPVVFKTKFIEWDDVLAVDFTGRGKAKKSENKAPKVDLSPLFKPRKEPMLNMVADALMEKYNSTLRSMQGYILEGKKFVELPKKEMGHFYSGDCYVFLCRYEYPSEEKDNSVEKEDDGEAEGEEDEDEDEPEFFTVLYFWQGRMASNLGWLTFTFDFMKRIEPLLEGQWEVQRVRQQQEDIEFLSHFGGKFIIHWGKRQERTRLDDYTPGLYQIRSNNSKICRRVVQVPVAAQSLNSAFCYVLKVPFENTGGAGIVYVWVGSKTTQEEQIHAEQMGRTMFEASYSNQTIIEGAEPDNFFWVAMRGRGPHDTDADYLNHTRLFRCSNELGYFAISERLADFCQDDLSDEDVMILDTGKEVFLWFGTASSEMEKKLALKSVQVYRKHLADQQVGVPRKIRLAKKGDEPYEFVRCFHGWMPWKQ